MAKYYAVQALEEAAKIDDHIWAMNVRIMLGQIERMYKFNIKYNYKHYLNFFFKRKIIISKKSFLYIHNS